MRRSHALRGAAADPVMANWPDPGRHLAPVKGSDRQTATPTPHAFRAWLDDLTHRGEDLARFLVATMNDPEAGIGYRLQAAQFIADRLYGKTEQKSEVEVKFNPLLLRVAGLKDEELLMLQAPEEPLPENIIDIEAL